MMKNSIVLVNAILVFMLLGFVSCRRAYNGVLAENIYDEKDSFITIWKVGDKDPFDQQIFIPVNPEFKYNYDIRWSKVGASNTNGESLNNTESKIIKFPSPGEYRVVISGEFPAIFFKYQNDIRREKLLSVEQWGSIKWKSMNGAFAGCKNLQINAKDIPDLSRVSDMSNMFANAKSFNQSIENWDVSNVTTMDMMFYGAASFNQPLDKWNVASVSNMSYMFGYAVSFDQNLNSWSLRMKKYVNRAKMFSGAESFKKRTRISSWGLSEGTCKELFGDKC